MLNKKKPQFEAFFYFIYRLLFAFQNEESLL
jgi:hypothetical protein